MDQTARGLARVLTIEARAVQGVCDEVLLGAQWRARVDGVEGHVVGLGLVPEDVRRRVHEPPVMHGVIACAMQ